MDEAEVVAPITEYVVACIVRAASMTEYVRLHVERVSARKINLAFGAMRGSMHIA